MSSIQDIHSLEERINGIVDGYVRGDYNEDEKPDNDKIPDAAKSLIFWD